MKAQNRHAKAQTENHCRNCGNHVSESFTRVYGDNNGIVHECLECSTEIRLRNGHAARDDDGGI